MNEQLAATATEGVTVNAPRRFLSKPDSQDQWTLSSIMPIRSFSSQFEDPAASRDVDNDAPPGLRQEWIDVVYLVLERQPRGFSKIDEKKLYNIISQSLGIQPSGEPYSGFRYAISRDVGRADWQRFYDLIIRVAAEVPTVFQTEYRQLVNQLLAVHRIAWELHDDDHLRRILPAAIGSQAEAAFRELSQPRFSAALASFQGGMAAYNDRPQRAKDACKNIFDAVEATAKEVNQLPTATFGNVLTEIRRKQSISVETLASLQKLYDLANNHFRHGMTSPFALKAAEVDYFLVSCLAAILLFIRM